MADQVVSQTHSPGSCDSQEELRPLSSVSNRCKACLHSDLRETSLLQWMHLSPIGPCHQKSQQTSAVKTLDLSQDPKGLYLSIYRG